MSDTNNETIYSLRFTAGDIRGYEVTDDNDNVTRPFADFTDEQCQRVGQIMEKSMGWADTIWDGFWQILHDAALETKEEGEDNE